MQTVSYKYRQIFESGDYTVEHKVIIDGVEYGEEVIWNMSTTRGLFKEEKPMIGCAVAGEIELTMDYPGIDFPIMAEISPYIRLKQDKGHYYDYTNWMQKGVFFIDTRKINEDSGTIYIHGYDAMRRSQIIYPSSSFIWSKHSPNAYNVVREIASHMGVLIDNRTVRRLTEHSYVVGFPAQYTMHEVLENIAAMYGGNFCMSDDGKLLFVGIHDIPPETFYLITEKGDYITFGGTRILLRG